MSTNLEAPAPKKRSGTQRRGAQGVMSSLLLEAVNRGASDLHLTSRTPPFLRIHGELVLTSRPPLDRERLQALVYCLMTEMQIEEFERRRELCFSLTIEKLGYFRITVYRQRGNVEAAIRVGMTEIRTAEDLGLPAVVDDMSRKPNGLILITGPTGSGKTTTLNALIDGINRDRRVKIVTIEDPVEYLHENKKSIVVQQEVQTDAGSYASAVVNVLRQDPDVIAIGEMRDLETIGAALTAAETGHLVLATLHSNDCPQTVNRVVDVFPETQQQQVRHQLSLCLRGIVNLRLLPRLDQPGRVVVYSVLVGNPAVQHLIRENKLSQIPNVMQTGRRDGMAVMDEMVRDLYQRAVISYDVAVANVTDAAVLTGKGGSAAR